MTESILDSTKKILGIEAEYTAFDLDIMTHINSIFSVLHQLGIGPTGGFRIDDNGAVWSDFVSDDRMNSVKTYVFLRVRLLFDPPTTSFHQTALKEQYEELEWRLNVVREGDAWTLPVPTPTPTPVPVPDDIMSTAVYDPTGVYDDSFDVSKHHGALDGGNFT